MVLARSQVVPMPQMRRIMRRPQHTFNIREKAFQIVPFMIAPVLPGETLKNLLFQARSVSDPVLHPLIGWWKEFYFFYVKHRDLNMASGVNVGADLTNMMLSPTWTPAATTKDETSDGNWFHGASAGGNQINFVKLCYQRCVEEFFRNDGEAWNTYLIGSQYAAAQINMNNFLDSATTDAVVDARDVAVEGPDADTVVEASEIDSAMRQWELLRMQGLTNQTYEEYLMTYGVRPERTELHRPELVRYVREWTYPSNTVEPTTGVPSSALSWSISERADKDRFLREPGFIFGLSVSRPKIYLSRQRGTLTSFMNNVYSWLPATLRQDINTSWRKFTPGTGPLKTDQAADYWVDFRDLFVYGEQFVNFTLGAAVGDGSLALPTTALQKRYPTEAMVNDLFVDNVNDVKVYVKSDGVVNLTIAGTIRDETPSVNVA